MSHHAHHQPQRDAMLMALLILFAGTSPTTSMTPKSRAITKIDRYPTFTFPRTPKISEDRLIIKDFSTFVHNHSLQADAGPPSGNKTFLRMKPHYPDIVSLQVYNEKMFGMMKQSLYAAQDRLKYLQGILGKYEDDVSFRAGYIFTKLDQLLQDMQRIYSYTIKKYDYRTIHHNIIFYRHLTKKNIDVTYIVEFLFPFHDKNVKTLRKIFSQFANANE